MALGSAVVSKRLTRTFATMPGYSGTRPSGVVTFVLSDLVHSTALWERVPAAMDRCLRRCEEIVGGAVAANHGTLLKSRGEGDSTFSVFGRATDAINAAYVAQRSLTAEHWNEDTPVLVRMAVHTGEAVERDGDYFGPAVNRAARLRSLAHGGQVLVSRATAELVVDHLDADVRLMEMGEQQLRGMGRPEIVFALVGPGLAEPATISPPTARSASVLDERGVTRKEREVLTALAERLTNAEIAARLYVSPRTVESHVSSLLRKLDASNRRELAGRAAETLVADDSSGGTAATDAAPRLPAALELLADPATYVGRSDERARLGELWDRACSGHTLIAVIAGEAGIGKSRLVAELATEVHADGGRVLFGSCFEDGQRPYEPFVHAISDDAAGLRAPEIRRRAGGGGPALVRIVPELARVLRVAPPGEVVDTATERADVFTCLHGYLSRAADPRPLLLVIEDLHWASATTRDALRHLARAGGHAAMLIVVTTRDVAPDLDETLTVFLADLAHLPGVDTILLGGLAEPELAQLLNALRLDADPGAVRADTGGNPLFVRELASSGGVGGSLAGLLARRYARLTADDLGLLDLACVLGAEFGADLLAATAGRDVVDVVEALERAEAAGLVAASPGRPGRFSFVHALFRTARYSALTSARRLRLHRQVVQALERRSGDVLLPELARHACIAAPLGGAHEAIGYARRAGQLAERSLALDEAAAHYERALAVAHLLDPADPKVRLELAIRLGEALNRSGNPRYREVLLAAAEAARSLGDADALAQVAFAMIQYGVMTMGLANDAQFVAIAEEALAGLGPEPTATRARVLAALSSDVMHLDPQRARELVCEARDIARAVGDPVTLGQVLFSYRFAGYVPGGSDAGHPTADELIALGRRTGQKIFTITGLETRAAAFRAAGDLAACDQTVEEYAAVLGDEELPRTYVRVLLALFRSARYALAGDLAMAERAARDILTLAKGAAFDPANWFGSALWTIRHNQHRLGRFSAFYRRGIVREPGLDDYLSAILALAYLQARRTADAHIILRGFADAGFQGVRPNFLWTAKMAMLCETAEMTADAEAAAALVTLLRPHSGSLAANSILVFAPIDLALSQAALTAGDAEQAETFAANAVAASRQRNTPIFLGRELVRLAEARRRRGRDHDEIRPLVDEALELANRTGAVLIRREADHYGLAGAP